MLRVVLDNDNARLAQGAVAVLAAPAADPLLADTIVVGQVGVGRWLEQRVAQATGVSANCRIELPSRFIWNTVGKIVKGTSPRPPFDPLVVRWAIFDAMNQLPSGPAYDVIAGRWMQASATEQMMLATDLSILFERYLAYRRDWLDRWANRQSIVVPTPGITSAVSAHALLSSHQPWQQWLWLAILERVQLYSDRHPFDALRASFKNHRARPAMADASGQGQLFDDEHAQAGSQASLQELIDESQAPRLGRIVMFGVLDMPAEQMQMIGLLGQLTDITWFAKDPAQGFWEDLTSPTQAARITAQSPQAGWLYDAEPTVLGEWGMQQRDFLAQVRELQRDHGARVIDEALREREAPGIHTVLSTMQSAVFELSDDPWRAYLSNQEPGSIRDPSLQIHGCHSLIRQIEVAHDCILAAFAELPDLKADEVVIFCADVDTARPLVQAVFAADNDHPLPVQVSGHSHQSEPQVRAFEMFLSLVQGPAHITSLIAWFDTELARTVCRLDDGQLAQLRNALESAGIHRDDLDESEPRSKHGWQAGLDRLILTGFTGADVFEPVAGTLACGHMDTSMSRSVGLVAALLADIAQFRGSGGLANRSVEQWSALLLQWCDRWLVSRELSPEGLYRVRDALSQLTQSAQPLRDVVSEQAVPFGVIAQALSAQLRESGSTARSSGAITVAPFGSLRHLPYRVCVLVGMDHGRWPSAQVSAEYDLTRVIPRFGDRSPTQQARGIFLDALLDTTDRLVIAYSARDDRTNQVSNPARVVVELSDYVSAQCIAAGWSTKQASAPLTITHPLQPFSPRRFIESQPASFARSWFDAAQFLAAPGHSADPIKPVATNADATPTLLPAILPLTELIRGVLQPAQLVMRHRAAMRIARSESDPTDIEPFEFTDVDKFDRQDLVRHLLQLHRAGKSRTDIVNHLQARPQLPGGSAAAQTAAVLFDEMLELAKLDGPLLAHFEHPQALDPRALSVRVGVHLPQAGDTLVTGRLEPTYRQPDGTMIQILPGQDQASVWMVVRLWYQHWLLAGSGLSDGAPVITVCGLQRPLPYARSKFAQLVSDAPHEQAQSALQAAIVLHQSLSSEPRALFPNTAGRWMLSTDRFDGDPNRVPIWLKAQNAYFDNDGRGRAESLKPWPNALWRDSPAPLTDVLRDSFQVYGPMWRAAFGLADLTERAPHE